VLDCDDAGRGRALSLTRGLRENHANANSCWLTAKGRTEKPRIDVLGSRADDILPNRFETKEPLLLRINAILAPYAGPPRRRFAAPKVLSMGATAMISNAARRLCAGPDDLRAIGPPPKFQADADFLPPAGGGRSARSKLPVEELGPTRAGAGTRGLMCRSTRLRRQNFEDTPTAALSAQTVTRRGLYAWHPTDAP